MSGKILQINFKFKVSKSDYIDAATLLASTIADLPGLLWKVWIINEDECEAGGIYWFKDAVSLQAYLDGPIVAGIVGHPALENVSTRVFDNIARLSKITNGPVTSAAV